MRTAILLTTSASAVLAGKVINGTLQMKATKAIQTLADGCSIASISLTPFGINRYAMDFTEAGCEGGQLIITRQ